MTEAKKTSRKVIDENAPWLPVVWTDEEAGALQALYAGKAQEHQQKQALDFIINKVCATYDAHYFPGPEGQRNTDFALGRAFPGQQIVKMLKLNLTKLRTTMRGENG
jgi:hypothetical protein